MLVKEWNMGLNRIYTKTFGAQKGAICRVIKNIEQFFVGVELCSLERLSKLNLALKILLKCGKIDIFLGIFWLWKLLEILSDFISFLGLLNFT